MAVAMAFDLLPTLRPRQWHATICVRVCRKWEYRGGTDDGPIQHVDLVLLDEKGNSIYGEIPEHEVQAKSPLLEENGIYVISRFRVSNAKTGYRPVDSPFMVEFTLRTTVSAVRTDMHGFPEYAYRLTPIDELAGRAGDTKNFLDTIGVLVEVSEAYMVRLPNKPAATLTRHIVLRDLRYSEMKITLWGHRATAFSIDGVYNQDEAKPIVVLFVGGLMKSYQGSYYLSGNAASRWYFDPSIPEATQFRASLEGQRIEVRSVSSPRQESALLQAPAERVEKTLKELNDMDPYDFNEHGYRCTVTVGRLTPNASWWFPSCSKCSKSCVPDGAGYRCNACSNTSFKFKYKISFVALDGTDEAEMICFGDVARRIVGKSVQQLLRTSPNANTYPPDVVKIVSLRFTFAVALTQQSYYKPQKTYQIISVVTPHGRRPAVAAAVGNSNPPSPGHAASQSTSEIIGTSDGTLSSSATMDTPAPSLYAKDPPSVKSQLCENVPRDGGSSVKKRLAFEDKPLSETSAEIGASEDAMEKVSLDITGNSDTAKDNLAPQNKRARQNQSLLEQSG